MPGPTTANPIRSDILNAGAKVFSEKGYERATLDDVAQVVGMKRGSLYYHLASKEHLLIEIHRSLNTALIERTREAIDGAEGDPVEQLRRLVFVIVDLISSKREWVNVALRDHHALSPATKQLILDHRQEYRLTVERVVAKIQSDSGRAHVASPSLVSFALQGMTYWLHEWYDGQWEAEEIADVFSELTLFGLLGDR